MSLSRLQIPHIARSLVPVLFVGLPGLLAPPARASSAAQGPPPTPVVVDAVREEVLAERRRVTGDLLPAQRSSVATQEAGLVVELAVREGELVERGALLARLDASRLEIERSLLDAQQQVTQAVVIERDSELEQERRDLESLLLLAERDAANPKELADARTALARATARLEQARLELAVIAARRKLLDRRIADTEIRAPFEGLVSRRRCELGEWLGAGSPVVELVSSLRLEAWIDVPQRDFQALITQPGAIRVEVEASGVVLMLESYRILGDIDRAARTFTVVAPLPPESRLAPGMSLRAEVPTSIEAKHLTLSNDALLRNEVGNFVYVAVPDASGAGHQALPMPVEVLFRTSERAVVRSPAIAPGMLVIVEGNERLYPTAAVRPMQRAVGSTEGAPAESVR